MPTFCRTFTHVQSRRAMLQNTANGFGLLALGSLFASDSLHANDSRPRVDSRVNALQEKQPHFKPRAKRIIFLFMHGGPSQVDTFDHKPLLKRFHGQPFPGNKPRVQFASTGNLLRSPWEFRPGGKSGIQISDLFPELRKQADELTVIRSIHADNAAHGGALLQLHTGSDTFIRPSIGSWITYGLGTENQNLPGFVTICPTLGHGGIQNWSSSFLPAMYQGTPIGHSGIKCKDATISDLTSSSPQPVQRQQLDYLRELNARYGKSTGPESSLDARISSFELAFRMQTEAPQVMDLNQESEAVKQLYGIGTEATDNFGRQCLLARRFAEAGVRFIQVSHSYKWDQHGSLKQDHARNALEVDRPIAALLNDLKRRGLLDDTLVWWGGEFGRTPTAQGADGRDHNPHAFSMWMAGGGIRKGYVHGKTDDFGYYAVENKVHMHDLHATLLAALGLDHEKLTYRHAGRDFRLTDVKGQVVTDIFA